MDARRSRCAVVRMEDGGRLQGVGFEKVNKFKYVCVREGGGRVLLQGVEVVEVDELEYMGSTVQIGWSGWRRLKGVHVGRMLSERERKN